MKVNVLSRVGIKPIQAGGPSKHTFYEVWDEKQRKEYIDKHPDSKYSKENQDSNSPSPSTTKPKKEAKKFRKVSSKNPKDKPVVDALNDHLLPKLASVGIGSKVKSNWGADGQMHFRFSSTDSYDPLEENPIIPDFAYDPETNSFSVDSWSDSPEIKKLEGKKLKPEQLNEVVDMAVRQAEKNKKEANDKGFVTKVDLLDSRGKDPIEFYKSRVEHWSHRPYTDEEINNEKDPREKRYMKEFNLYREDSLKEWKEKLKRAEQLKK
jgi:hypothetical protein